MGLAVLALETVLLVFVGGARLATAFLRLAFPLARGHTLDVPVSWSAYNLGEFPRYNLLLVLLDLLLVQFVQSLQSQLDVGDECITARLAEILTDDNTHELQLVGVWRHGVSWDDPSAFSENVSKLELIV